MPIVDGSAITTLEPLPADEYPAQLVSAELNQGTKGPYYKCVFEVTEGEFEGRKQYRNASIAPQSLWNFKEMCVALGDTETDWEGEFDTDDVIIPLIGSACRLVVGQKEYQGRVTNEVTKVLAPSF